MDLLEAGFSVSDIHTVPDNLVCSGLFAAVRSTAASGRTMQSCFVTPGPERTLMQDAAKVSFEPNAAVALLPFVGLALSE